MELKKDYSIKSFLPAVDISILNGGQIVWFSQPTYQGFWRIIEICRWNTENQVNGKGNIPYCDVVPTFSDLEVVGFFVTVEEAFSIDSKPVKVYRNARANRCTMDSNISLWDCVIAVWINPSLLRLFQPSPFALISHSEYLLAGVLVPHRETMRSSPRNTLFLTEERGLSRCGRKGWEYSFGLM